MLILHVSDTHLGSSKPLTYSRAREDDFYDVFNEVVDIAVRERVDAVIHAGDFFDSPEPSNRAYLYAIRALRRLSEAGIPFLVIAGQHDQPKRAEVSPLKVLEEVGVARLLALGEPSTHVIKLRGGELGVTAIPYAAPEVMQKWVKSLRRPEAGKRVLVAHLLLRELGLPAEAHLSIPELNAASYNYVALGDYHRRYEARAGGTPVVYPGSTEALSINERSDERYVALVDLSKGEASLNWAKLTKFRRLELLEGVGGYADLLKRLEGLIARGLGKPPILYIKFSKPRKSVTDIKLIEDKLGELLGRERILAYKLEYPDEAGGEERYAEAASSSQLTMEEVVYEVAGDPEVAEFLINVIKSSEDREAVRKLLLEAIGNERLISKIEKALRGARP